MKYICKPLKLVQGKDENLSDAKESVADAVDFFGHKRSNEQSVDHDRKSPEGTKSKAKKKFKHDCDDEDRHKKTNKKRKRSMLIHYSICFSVTIHEYFL